MALVRRLGAPLAVWCAAAGAACQQVALLDQFEFQDCVIDDLAVTCRGKQCGTVVNNCGQQVTCGTCKGAQMCGGCGAGANKCGCECALASDCAARRSCVMGKCVEGRSVFFLSTAVPASFGGVAQADNECRMAAGKAGLKGVFSAWLSDSKQSAGARIEHATVPYRLVDGIPVAADWAGLTSGTLEHGIDLGEDGKPAGHSFEIWTGTAPSGSAASPFCSDWTNNAMNTVHGTVGIVGKTDKDWTAAYEQFCNRNDVHLYCIEQ